MTESKDELRDRHFSEAQAAGWVYQDSVPQPGEGMMRKTVLQMRHPSIEGLHLFIGPRGGIKTGRSYRSSACKFWQHHAPTPDEAAQEHGKA